VDPRGELKSYSSFCFPRRSRTAPSWTLLSEALALSSSRISCRMPQDNPCRTLICVRSLSRALFPGQSLSRPSLPFALLDFTRGYEASSALVELAVASWGSLAAWSSKPGQRRSRPAEVRARPGRVGQQTLTQAVSAGKPAILLAGRSYNAFTPEGCNRRARSSPAWA